MAFEDLFPEENESKPQRAHSEEFVPPVDGATALQPISSPPIHPMMKPSNLFGHQEEMWNILDEFDQKAWSASNVGIKTGWKQFDDAFDGGLKTGWVIVAGDSNIGKTSFLSLMAWNISQANNDTFVMDFSLDDPLQDKIPRVVASANKVMINAVRTPNNFTQFPDMLKRRKQGLDMIYNSVDRYRCYDANHSTDIDDIETSVQNMIVNLEEEALHTGNPRRKLVVLIDNFHDLTTTNPQALGSDKMKYDYLAQRVSDMATKYDIPVITTAEFKKLNGFRRPGLDDIRESVKIKYEAKAILLCYNEVGLKGEAASIYYDVQGKNQKQPVFEVKFGKNKMSGFKGRIFYEFYPELAYFEEADKPSTQRYNNLIYSNE